MNKQEKTGQLPMQPMKEPGKSEPGHIVKRLLGPAATIFSSVDTGSWRINRPAVDVSCCTACGICRSFCPTDVIDITKEDKKQQQDQTAAAQVHAQVHFVIDWNYCKGCGICADVCPKKCIRMIKEDEAK